MTQEHRWADAARTLIRREDGALIPADPDNADYAGLLAAEVEIGPFARFDDIAKAKVALLTDVEAHAEGMRRAITDNASGSKRDVYAIKYDFAVRALAGDNAALAMFNAEAAARDETPTELATLVKSLGDQWRAAGLAIDAAYQMHKAAILALANLNAAENYDAGAGWPF